MDKARDKGRRESVRGGITRLQPVAVADDDEAQFQAGASTSLGSFQSWLIDATHRMEKDRQERDHSNLMDTVNTTSRHSSLVSDTPSSLFPSLLTSVVSPVCFCPCCHPVCVRLVCQAYVEVHQRFDTLLAEHNKLLSDFFSVLLAVRVKEAAQTQTLVHHMQAAVRCERINYQLVKHEKPTLNLYVDQLNATATFAPDATIDCVVEVRAIGGRVLLPHYLDQLRPEYAWQEMIALYAPDKTADSAWRDVMLHAHFTGRFDRSAMGGGEHGEAVIRHSELNLHPIAVRLTYEGIMLIVEYFVTEQQKMSKQSASYRDTFLPLSQAVLDVDGDVGSLSANDKAEREREKQLLGIASGSGGSAPHSPKGGDHEHRRKGMKDRMKGISHFFHRDKHHSHSHSTSHSQHGHTPSVTAGHAGDAEDELHSLQADDDSAASTLTGTGLTASVTSGMNLPRPIAPAPPHHHHSHSLSTSSGGASSTGVPSRPVLSSLPGEADGSGGSVSVPATPSSGAALAARKSRSSATSASTSLFSDAEREGLQQQRADVANATAVPSTRKQQSTAANHSPLLYVQYLRLGASVLSLSYMSGGSKKYNIEDFQGLTVRVKPFTLQKRELTAEQLVKELRNQQLKALLRQVTATLGNFLSYKLGFSRPSGGTAAVGQAAAGGVPSASSAAATGTSVMSSVDESREGDDEYDSDHEGAAGTVVITSADASPAVSRSSLRSGLASVGSSRVRALFGDKSKKRKDSDGRDREREAAHSTPHTHHAHHAHHTTHVAQPSAVQPQSLSMSGATSSPTSSALAAPPSVPPRPLSALLSAANGGVGGSGNHLSTAGIHISAPLATASGRGRSVSSGDTTESRTSSLPQSASSNTLASTHSSGGTSASGSQEASLLASAAPVAATREQ